MEDPVKGRVPLTKGTEVFDGHKLVWVSFDLCIDCCRCNDASDIIASADNVVAVVSRVESVVIW